MVRTSWIPNLCNFAPEILQNTRTQKSSEFNSLRNPLPYTISMYWIQEWIGMGFESDVMLKGNEVILPVKICTLQQVKANSPDFNALKVDSKVISIASKNSI